MSLNIDTISTAKTTVDEALSVLMYMRNFEERKDTDEFVYFDGAKDPQVKELISHFCNNHAMILCGIGGELVSPIPQHVYRLFCDDGTVVEGAMYDNGGFAKISTPDCQPRWLLKIDTRTVRIYSYPAPV